MTIQRRDFLGLAATALAVPAVGLAQAQSPNKRPGLAFFRPPGESLTAQRGGDNACLPDWKTLPTRVAPTTEILYKTPHGQPNGLALTANPNEIWVLDQGGGHWISLISIKDGSLIREIQADVVGPSGIVVDGDTMWITSTHNSIIVRCDIHTGKTIAKYVTPGAGRIFIKYGDPPGRRTKLPLAYPNRPRGLGTEVESNVKLRNNVGLNTGSGLGPGRLPLDAENGLSGTGAHGILLREPFLIYACPPSRAMFKIHKIDWVVYDMWPTPGNRPHGTTWNDESMTSFWNVDSNLNAYYHFNENGRIIEKVEVRSPPHTVCHGAKLITRGYGAGYMYFVDDVGWMCRIKWT